MKEQMEKSRVLQESLHALAAEHHELERSLHRHASMRSLPDEDEFQDCDDDSFGVLLLCHSTLCVCQGCCCSCLAKKSHPDMTHRVDYMCSNLLPIYSQTKELDYHIFTFTYPFTVGAPQMTSQPVFSVLLCFPLPIWTWQTPGLSIH